MQYKRVVISQRGGPEALHVVNDTLREPVKNEIRIKVMAAGVSFADVLMREGVYMGMPKFPFTPGYDIVGLVDKLGENVTELCKGDYVAALTVHGGYSEYIFLPEYELVKIPNGIDPVEAVSLVLNYITAYQMLFRTANVKDGEKILVHGAAGGVGTALLQLAKLKKLTVYGTASVSKHQLVENLGAIPIDYKSENFEKKIKRLTNEGVDTVFDGTGELGNRSYKFLRKNGRLIIYGISSMLKDGRRNILKLITTYLRFSIFLKNLIPDSKRVLLYQITGYKKLHPDWFKTDLETLLELLREKKIKPIIYKVLPLDKVNEAHNLLNNSSAQGKIVLSLLKD
ncbi:oxidoreductase [bacterium]|nr:oxidoreductase [bacterium]